MLHLLFDDMPTHVRNVSEQSFDEFLDFLDSQEQIPYPTWDSISLGAGFQKYRIMQDDRRYLTVIHIPKETLLTVNMSEPEKVETHACVVDDQNEKAWYVESNAVNENEQLADVRQAQYESKHFKDREADYKYHFPDETIIAKRSPDPVSRVNPVEFTAMEFLGGEFPKIWLLETADEDVYYLRERSGSIKLYDDISLTDGKLIFQAYIGGEHPGTNLNPEEVIEIITSVDYFSLVDNYDTDVSKEAKDSYWGEEEQYDDYEKYLKDEE